MASRTHVSTRLVRAVEAACVATCPGVCEVRDAVEIILAHIHDNIIDILNQQCAVPDRLDAASSSGHQDCVNSLVRYVCSDAVQQCTVFTAVRGEAMRECLTRATGTFGDMHEPWTEHNATVLWLLIFVLAVAVFWHSAISVVFSR